jgi:hypothetical protein
MTIKKTKKEEISHLLLFSFSCVNKIRLIFNKMHIYLLRLREYLKKEKTY